MQDVPAAVANYGPDEVHPRATDDPLASHVLTDETVQRIFSFAQTTLQVSLSMYSTRWLWVKARRGVFALSK